MHGLVCDYERDLERIPLAGPRVIAFLGGTIGNFEPAQRASFLARVANLLGPEDHFLLGTDLVKSREALEAAYNDSAGVTAEFNKNVLSVLNRELGANFDLDAFEHVAFWDHENLWVDIRLRSLARQVIEISSLGMQRRLRARRGDANRDLDQVRSRAASRDLRRGGPRDRRLVDRPRRTSSPSRWRAARNSSPEACASGSRSRRLARRAAEP